MIEVAVLGYACLSAHGRGVQSFWHALKANAAPKSFLYPDSVRKDHSQLSFLTFSLTKLWDEIRSNTSVVPQARLGVIFASTKGNIDDIIWDEVKFHAASGIDTLTPVLESFLKHADLKPAVSISVSNACASSLSALHLGMKWIEQKRVDQVLVLSADLSGNFVQKGFACLNALSKTNPKPFSKDRDGLALGEAVSAILIGDAGANSNATSSIILDSIGINAEGYAVTRPSPSGSSLKRAYEATSKLTPDLIIAHGTATTINDVAEDQAFFELFGNEVPITGTKWAIGHTLGVSGSMDFIAACEIFKRGETFSLGTTLEIDPTFRAKYLSKNSKPPKATPNTILISSLGFGGIHAVAILKNNVGHQVPKRAHEMPKASAAKIGAAAIDEKRIDFNFVHPAPVEPLWKNKVDRWYQLDAAAYGLAEFYQQHALDLGPNPDLIVLASPAASNSTDYQFASSGAQSPAKFVHTLPNIRVSPLFQVMGWNGPVFCLQNGQNTLESALIEARHLLDDSIEKIWVLSVKDFKVSAFSLKSKAKDQA